MPSLNMGLRGNYLHTTHNALIQLHVTCIRKSLPTKYRYFFETHALLPETGEKVQYIHYIAYS